MKTNRLHAYKWFLETISNEENQKTFFRLLYHISRTLISLEIYDHFFHL